MADRRPSSMVMVMIMSTIAFVISNAPSVIGAVGGTVGIISGIAVFMRRRLRLVASITHNNDAHYSWVTINISNGSDLALPYRDVALAWYMLTPLGRLRLNWAYMREDETDVQTLAPHSATSLRIDDEGWNLALPLEKRHRAYLRMYIYLPSRGRAAWVPVQRTKWTEETLRERLLNRVYRVNQPTKLPFPPPAD